MIAQDMAMPGGRYRSIVAPSQRNGIDNLLMPDEVAGVEMYNARNVPTQYNVTAGGASCGATLIWTK